MLFSGSIQGTIPAMTVFARFVDEFPDREETKVLTLLERITGKEIQRIYLDERYCADPECDCQRVLLYAHDPATNLLAAITYDFLGRSERTPTGVNPFLEPAVQQPPGAEAVFFHVKRIIESEPAYRDRLRRHYAELKERTRDRAHPLWPTILEDRRMMTRIAKQMAAAARGPRSGPDRSQQEKNRAKRERQLRRAKR